MTDKTLASLPDGGAVAAGDIGYVERDGNSRRVDLGDSMAGKQPLDADLTAIAGLSTQAYGRSLLTTASAQAAQSTLGVREALTAARTYFVRTDGSDSNNGLTDSASGAFLTIQKAIDTVAALDIGPYDVTISARDGTYTGQVVVKAPWVGTGAVTIIGESAAGTIISTTSASAITVTNGARIVVQNVELRTTTSGNCLFAEAASVIQYSGVRFGTCAGYHIESSGGSTIVATGNYSIVGGASGHLHCPFGGVVITSSITVTLTGTPNFSGFYVGVSANGSATIVSTTFSGSATGPRFYIWKGGHLGLGGANPNTYLPGNAAGTLDSGGSIDTTLGATTFWFGSGDVTVTYATDVLAFGGAASGFFFANSVQPGVDGGPSLGANGAGWAALYVASGGGVRVNNVQVVGGQQTAVADVATGGSATAAANATAINAILARLRTHGLIAT